jgi:Dynamin family
VEISRIRPVSAPPWLDVLDETIRVCGARGRPDLAERLRQRRTRLLDPKVRVLVVGEPGQGKSQLINALVNAPVCAVGDGITTLIPTVVEHADTPAAAVVTPTGERVAVPVEEVAASVGGPSGAEHRPAFVRAEVAIPRELLASGLVLIDTPGIDDPGSIRAQQALVALGQADAALVVSATTHELTTSELSLLRRVVAVCPTVTVVLTKTDLAPDWRQVLDRNRDRLAQAGIPVRLVAVSAALRLRAARSAEQELNAESGFPDLVGHLHRDLAGQPAALAGRTVAAATRAALAELVAPLRAELSARGPAPGVVGPAGRQVPGTELPEVQLAQRRLNALRRRNTRWQNVLSDEIADLVADVEYDLRDRTRKILRKVDEAFDAADPLQIWDSFADWLEENLSEAAERNFAWLLERSEWIAKAIAANFPPDQPGIYPESTFEVPRDLFDAVTRPQMPAFERFTATQKIHSGLRGSYGGVLMAGLITSLAGMPVINAISVAAGGMFGTRSLRDESQLRLKRRQATAKAAAQRHVDDFFLKFGKDSKDIARRVQRRLRDHFTAVTEELQESIISTARTARQAVDRDAAELSRELEQLAALQRQAQALAGRGALAVA